MQIGSFLLVYIILLELRLAPKMSLKGRGRLQLLWGSLQNVVLCTSFTYVDFISEVMVILKINTQSRLEQRYNLHSASNNAGVVGCLPRCEFQAFNKFTINCVWFFYIKFDIEEEKM